MQGSAEAEGMNAHALETGKGVPKDIKQAGLVVPAKRDAGLLRFRDKPYENVQKP